MPETKVIYHLEGEDTPFLIKIPLEPTSIKLKDLKTAISLNTSPTHIKYKYLFKTIDEECEMIVKIEINSDDQKLPLFDNRIICWLKPMKHQRDGSSLHTLNSGNSQNSQNYNNTNTNSHLNSHFDLDQPIQISSSTPNTSNIAAPSNSLNVNDSGNGSGNVEQSRQEPGHLGGPGQNNNNSSQNSHTDTIEKLSSATKNLSIVKTSSTLNTSNSSNQNTLENSRDKKPKPKPPPRNLNGSGGALSNGLDSVPTSIQNQMDMNNGGLANSLQPVQQTNSLPNPHYTDQIEPAHPNHTQQPQEITKTTKKYFSNLKRFPSDTTLDSTMTEEFTSAALAANRKSLENEFFDDGSSRYSTMTTSTNNFDTGKNRKKRQHRRKMMRNSKMTESMSTFSSMTDSTVSLNIVLATLDMTKFDTLGITLISDQNGGPVLVGYVFPTGAVAADGRIERGDIIIEINGISVEDKSTEEAVDIIRREAKNPINGTIIMTVAKQPLFPSEAEIVANDMNRMSGQGNHLGAGMMSQAESNSARQPSIPISCEQWVKSSQSHTHQGGAGMFHPFGGSTTSIETSSDTLGLGWSEKFLKKKFENFFRKIVFNTPSPSLVRPRRLLRTMDPIRLLRRRTPTPHPQHRHDASRQMHVHAKFRSRN